MPNLTKSAFVMAPVFLILCLISDYVLNLQTVKTVLLVLATLCLIIALIGKALETRTTTREEDEKEL